MFEPNCSIKQKEKKGSIREKCRDIPKIPNQRNCERETDKQIETVKQEQINQIHPEKDRYDRLKNNCSQLIKHKKVLITRNSHGKPLTLNTQE